MSKRLEGGGLSTINSNHLYDMLLYALIQYECRDPHRVRRIPYVERPAEFQPILQDGRDAVIPLVANIS